MRDASNYRRAALLWSIWAGALLILILLAGYPVSYRVTRLGSVALAGFLWMGLIVLTWRVRAISVILLVISTAAALIACWPSQKPVNREQLRTQYVEKLQRMDGVRYVWGGENSRGIDCSGLVRRGMIDALLAQGVAQAEPAMFRRAAGYWWNDCTAAGLGEGFRNLTVPVLETPALNEVDHSDLEPGDLAVTRSGVHVMAYLGNQTWIEADPDVGRVIVVRAPASENRWFATPMKIVRWRLLTN